MSRDPKSPLLKKRALDALLDSMADGLDGHDNYDELGAHRRGESTPEMKGTEFDELNQRGFQGAPVLIPAKDLAPPSGVEDAEFFKESQPKRGAIVYRSSEETDLGTQPIDELIREVQGDVDPVRVKEAAGEPVATSNPQSLKNIETSVEDIRDAVTQHMHQIADDLDAEDFSIHDILFTGSRLTGAIHDASDLDVVVFYEGGLREDDLFNLANENPLVVDGVNVDINPVNIDRRGELEAAGMVEKISADMPIEEEIEEHEFFKKAPEEVVAAKVAGHRVKDTGVYDEAKEARIRKIAQETAQYYEKGPKFDPKGEYICGGCHYMLGNKACAFVEGDDINKEHGTCRYWKIADGKAPVELERKYNKKDAGYAVRNDQPFGCSRCEYGFEANESDTQGRDMWCEFFGMHIDANACCNENNLHGDIHFNVDNSKQANFVALADLTKSAGKTLYHVTNTAKVPSIQKKGILPLQTSNWVKGPEGDRYGEGEIFAMDNVVDAVRWAAKMDWEFNQKMGSGKISIVTFTSGAEKWKTDSSDPISQGQNKGKWLKAVGKVSPEQITGSHVLTPEMVKSVVQGGDIKLGEEKTADVPTKSYGMGTPIGGTDNPDAGASDEPDELEDPGELSLDMTSSLDEDDSEAENERIYAMLDEEDDRAERMHTASAKRLDSAPFTVAAFKVASMEDVGWFAKSARPSEQKLELLQKQFKMTPEQMELCIAVDPSPNQSDFVAWIAKYFAKGGFQLPEDTEKIKGQLEKFQKFKKSPAFTFSKDIQQYDPPKLFETLETAESTGLGSKKEQKRELVNKGAEVVVNEGDVKIYRVTEPSAAKELGSGTNWCTAAPGSDYAAGYMKQGPLYIFFDGGSAVAQLHCESNQFMNRQDVCILESVTGQNEGYINRHVKQFLADPGLAKALSLLAAKEPNVKEWVQEHVADPEDVKKILGEAATEEIAGNAKFEQDLAQYNKELTEYEEQMKAYTPKAEKWSLKYDAYREKMDEWYNKQREGQDPGERPKEPAGRPEQPRMPVDPRKGGYGYNSYYNSRPERGKKFTMQVRHALASGTPLGPEIEQQLVEAGVNTQLLLKYGSLFHPGQPWQPLADSILVKVQKNGKVDKDAVDYAAKFVKGPWAEVEPYLLNKLFLVTRNMENMRTALDYAIRARKTRWPEFEAKIQKAKPGAASGYGAAQYAIRVLKKPWSAFPDIKRKKNGKINAEECMIVGNPGEARLYAEAFNSGKSWNAFEESALAANNLAALINYAADTTKQRMPALEEKILSGEKDAQESKGRQRHRQHTDLALDYSMKVIKGRWPEYEQKMLDYAKNTKTSGGYNSGEYKPSHGQYHSYDSRLDKRVVNYITQIVKGRWAELEQVLLSRYQEQPANWPANQNLVDGYLSTVSKICQERYKDNSDVPEPEDNVPTPAEQEGTYDWNRKKRRDDRRQKSFTKFQQDPQCYWPEGEERLKTRDPGYEAFIVNELRKRANPEDKENNKGSYLKDEKFVSPEDLATMERPKAQEHGGPALSYEEKEKKPSYTIWNGIWIGYYGMDTVEKYVDYMLSNGQTWQEGVDIMELHEDLEDIRGRWSHSTRPQRRQSELALTSSAERFRQRFSSSLLRKQALIDMEPSPSMLPPRDDLKGHMDQQMHDQMTKEVMKGVREPLNPKKKNRRPQINPLINPDGMVASAEDEKSEVRIRFRGKEEVLSSYKPEDIMKAIRHAENLSMANPGFPVVFILDEAGIVSEDTYINGNHVGETVEKFAAAEESDWKMMGKTGPHYYINTMEPDMIRAFHGKRFADAVISGNKVVVWRAGKPDETLKPGTFLTANKRVAEGWLTPQVTSFGGPKIYRYEVDPADLVNVENMEASELVYKPRTKTAEYTDQDAQDDETTQIWLDQVEGSEDEARRHFMQEDYLKQIAQDDGITMEALWDNMGEEYAAEFYGYPYKRVPDFTNEETKGLDEGKEEGQELRLPG